MDEVKNDDGHITPGVLLQAVYETYRATTHPDVCCEKDVWEKIYQNNCNTWMTPKRFGCLN